MMWSYRDLVYLRVLAWLRGKGMERARAAAAVGEIKADISKGQRVVRLRADRKALIADDELANRISGEDPLSGFASFFQEFDLLEPVADFDDRRLWGPDLVNPSDFTYISPWVLGGEPCVDGTRIPTASIWTVRHQRGTEI